MCRARQKHFTGPDTPGPGPFLPGDGPGRPDSGRQSEPAAGYPRPGPAGRAGRPRPGPARLGAAQGSDTAECPGPSHVISPVPSPAPYSTMTIATIILSSMT